MSRQPNVVWWKENGPRARTRFRFGPITSLLCETVQATSTCSPCKMGKYDTYWASQYNCENQNRKYAKKVENVL